MVLRVGLLKKGLSGHPVFASQVHCSSSLRCSEPIKPKWLLVGLMLELVNYCRVPVVGLSNLALGMYSTLSWS